ncbi:hypothetical protein Q7689_03785 [Nocardiopsis tropica]|uniref:hypothetical protein n=1 Tax=Nocardiopsis tropica TaxID=109330 RepID=UPI002E830FD7|nr:hypothetical protein [Nocardiopsis tropica]
MGSNQPDPAHAMSRGEAWEDLGLERSGSRPKFDRLTDTAVLYVPIHKEGVAIGYLWASVDGKAANFLSLQSADTEARNEKSVWVRRLLQAKRDGLTSIEALERWLGNPSGEQGGIIPPGSHLEKAKNLQELQDTANSQ